MAADLTRTAQGRAWPCLPHPVTGFRGPGCKGDFCPQVALEALRTFARLPQRQRPGGLGEVARVALRAWRVRAIEQPYMFRHGRRFKTVKWPVTWYGAYAVLDALGRYPALWRGRQADPGDRAALAELAACLVAYNTGPDGTITPRSVWRGFAGFSFGQKRRRSRLPPPGCSRCCTGWTTWPRPPPPPTSVRWAVGALGSSKGGSGVAVPPRPPVTPGAEPPVGLTL
jgi:hypothetical protein